MNKHKYDIKEIEIGDEITYRNKYTEAGFSTWRVIGKIDKTIIIIEKIEEGVTDKRMIDVSDIENKIRK